MPSLPSLPKTTHLGDAMARFPKGVIPLLHLHDALLRGDSEMSVAERETLAGYVSGLNGCHFCLDAHKLYAQAFGGSAEIIDKALEDVENAVVPQKLKPILKLGAALRTLPVEITPEHTQPVLDAGWSERTVAEVIHIAALFNYMNRIIEGFGVNFEHPPGQPSEAELQTKMATVCTE